MKPPEKVIAIKTYLEALKKNYLSDEAIIRLKKYQKDYN